MNNSIDIQNFSKHLFWDTNREALDFDKNEAYIIKQVLEYGKLKDWELIKSYYGISHIAEISTKFRSLEKKALSFISTLSEIPVEEFRCYSYQQSIPPHWEF